MSLPGFDWANRWVGGFCPLGVLGGPPIRGPDCASRPPLEQALRLSALAPIEAVTADAVTDAWSRALGGVPVVLVRSAGRARQLLLEAVGVGPDEAVAVPANATRSLVEAVKQRGAQPRFVGLRADLSLDREQLGPTRLIWSQPVAGLASPDSFDGVTLCVDHADSLPGPTLGEPAESSPVMRLWGLHLSSDPTRDGAVLAFFGPTGDSDAKRAAVAARLRPDDRPDLTRALAQCRRFTGESDETGLISRQRTLLEQVWQGIDEAAGLPLLPLPRSGVLPHGVAVQIPAECDTSTFYAYVRGENTPVRWLPEVRPLHYGAIGQHGPSAFAATAASLARWLLVPVGPDYSGEEVSHAVLGIVKASEYLGVRWRTRPRRALEYAERLTRAYGPDHDGYRPVFMKRDLADETGGTPWP